MFTGQMPPDENVCLAHDHMIRSKSKFLLLFWLTQDKICHNFLTNRENIFVRSEMPWPAGLAGLVCFYFSQVIRVQAEPIMKMTVI